LTHPGVELFVENKCQSAIRPTDDRTVKTHFLLSIALESASIFPSFRIADFTVWLTEKADAISGHIRPVWQKIRGHCAPMDSTRPGLFPHVVFHISKTS
jgi:hypothetical protein